MLSSLIRNKKNKNKIIEQDKQTQKFHFKSFKKKFRKYLIKNVYSNSEYLNYLMVKENVLNLKNSIKKLIVKKFKYLNEKKTKKILKFISNSINKNSK